MFELRAREPRGADGPCASGASTKLGGPAVSAPVPNRRRSPLRDEPPPGPAGIREKGFSGGLVDDLEAFAGQGDAQELGVIPQIQCDGRPVGRRTRGTPLYIWPTGAATVSGLPGEVDHRCGVGRASQHRLDDEHVVARPSRASGASPASAAPGAGDVESHTDLVRLADARHEVRVAEVALVEVDGRVFQPNPQPGRRLSESISSARSSSRARGRPWPCSAPSTHVDVAEDDGASWPAPRSAEVELERDEWVALVEHASLSPRVPRC